jgi:hypothetical protein
MKYVSGVLLSVLNLFLFTLNLYGQPTAQWHYPLYLSNMNYWHSRIPVEVKNLSAQDISGESVGIKIGNSDGQLHLVGVDAAGLRVVDSRGVELLWRVTSPDEELITEGFIPDESEFLFPVTVKAGVSEIFFIYYDNPAAWSVGAVIDCHNNVINNGFERETEGIPYGWRSGGSNEEQTVSLCRENPHSGEYCLQIQNKQQKTKESEAAKQSGIFIRGGATYRVEGWVKAQEAEGTAGWQVLVGNVASENENFTMQKLILDGGSGSYDWKKVTADFTAPQNANSARVYTLLEGKGTAWFDDIQFTCLTKDELKIEVKPKQIMTLKKEGQNNEWPDEKKWNIRVPIKIFNFGNSKHEGLPIYVRMEQIFLRLHDKVDRYSAMQLGNKLFKPFFRFENALLMDQSVSAQSEQTTFAYFARGQKQDSGNYKEKYAGWYYDKRNLVKNPGIKEGEANWSRLTSNTSQKKNEQGLSENGSTGERSLRLYQPAGDKTDEIGWTQNISIKPGSSYMFGAMVKCADITDGISVKMKLLGINETSLNTQFLTDKMSGTKEWTFISGVFRTPKEAVSAQMSLVLAEAGTAWFKGLLMMEVTEGYASSLFFDQRGSQNLYKLTTWPVNPIIKVFREDLPPEEIASVRITAAQNETEPLQLALRSPQDCSKMRVEVTQPVNSGGQKLNQVTVSIVGYVPVDYPSNYYEKKVPYWYLKYPTGPIGSDGWTGFWPDPLLPIETFKLKANTTQPIWIEVTVPEGTKSGDYIGQINLFQNDSLVKEIPWTIHVWDFALPKKNTFGAIYDYRSAEDMPEPGPDLFRNDLTRDDLRDMYLSFMAKHRISSGEINPTPKVLYQDGKVSIDFSRYDLAASYYFDELKNPFAYLPTGLFYLFGWAFPPGEKFNEKPYPGEYPYAQADRAKLRPEYKKAYQLVLKTFWDHLKEKGWSDRFILYLSDEPHMAENSNVDIVAQMKALCDMVHEVDPRIPIYVSTWNFRPEWEGYIDVWGLAYNGGEPGSLVPEKDLNHLVKSGARIWYTTDGNFCTETPYLALERLLPWFGYKYGAQAYEFWGVNWLTYNPYKYGWHSYIFESQAPGEESWKRYPNGDGFVIYPGKPIGQEGLVASIRLKQVREGAEDYEYLVLLKNLVDQADINDPRVKVAREALKQALELVNIPCDMGRYSTRILKNPDEVFIVRDKVAKSIEALIKN